MSFGRPIQELDRPHDLGWDRLVKVGNIYVKARNDRGLTLQEEPRTYASCQELINACKDDLPAPGTRERQMHIKVNTGGINLSTDDEIEMERHIDLELIGGFEFPAASTHNFIEFQKPVGNKDFDWTIRGGAVIIGTKATAIGDNIGVKYWPTASISGADDHATMRIKGLKFRDFKLAMSIGDYAAQSTATIEHLEITRISTRACDVALEAYKFFGGCQLDFAWSNAGIKMYSCSNFKLGGEGPNYYAGRAGLEIYLRQCNEVQADFIFCDSAEDDISIQLDGCKTGIWTNCFVRGVANGGAAVEAVNLASDGAVHSTDNQFIGWLFSQYVMNPAQHDIGIKETNANQNNNSYTSINGRDTASAALRVLGAGSKLGGGIQGRVLLV